MRKKKVFKRFISFTLACITALSTCVSVYATETTEEVDVPTEGTSNTGSTNNSSSDIISTYINLAAGKSEFGNDSDMSFTKDQLRFLGVYISNYFVPFGTEFGEAKNSETDKTMEEIKKSLETNLNFNDTYSKMFSEQLMSLARGSVKDLVFAGECKDGTMVIPSKFKIAGTYANFLKTMLGGTSDLLYLQDGGKLKEYMFTDDENKKLVKCYWGYMKGSNFVPMFDCYPDGSQGSTPSQVAFNKCLASVDTENGYGFNMYDITVGVEDEENKWKEKVNSLEDVNSGDSNYMTKAKEILEMSIWGSSMKVDCFGDILICGKQHQFVAVPGSMNPYAWVAVSEIGKDVLDAGESYNMVNVPSMSLANGGDLLTSTSVSNISSSNSGNNSAGGNNINNSGSVKGYSFLSDKNVSESTVFSLMNAKGNLEDKRKKMESAIKYVLSVIDDTKDNKNNYTVSITKSNITVTGKLGEMATIDYDKINKFYKDKNSKYGKFREQYDIITDGIVLHSQGGEVVKAYITKGEFHSAINRFTDKAKRDLVDGDNTTAPPEQETNPETGDSTVKIKNFTSKTARSFPDKYRLYRGDSSYNIDASPLPFSGGNATKCIEMIIDSYPEVYENDNSHLTITFTGAPGKDGVDAPKINNGDSVNYLNDCIVFIDNLGDFNFDNSSSVIEDYRAFPVVNYLTENSTAIDSEADEAYKVDPDTFSAGFTNIDNGALGKFDVSQPLAASLYVTYCMSSLYGASDEDKAETIGRIGFRMNTESLPEIPDEPLDISASVKADLILTSIRDWLYYLLHPTEGLNYFRELITNKVNAFLVGWHNDMLGTHGVGQTLGTTRYRNTTGYVTTPDLSEIEWTNSLINFYNSMIPFLLVVMIVTMVLAYVTGILSIQKSIFGVAIFAIFLLMPVNLINSVVGVSNRVSEKIYGEKFTYWALMQVESYAGEIDKAAEGDSNATGSEPGTYLNYLTTLYNKNSKVYSNQGNESIVLKWQAPKKMTSLMYQSDDSYESLRDEGKDMMDRFLGTTMTGQSFVDDPDSVYLYRSYVDISNYARYVYRGIQTDPKQPSKRDLSNDTTSNWTSSLYDAVQEMGSNYMADRTNGYVNANKKGNEVSSGIKITVPFSSAIINDALGKIGSVRDLTINDYVGISPLMFNIGIPAFNKDLDLKEELKAAAGEGDKLSNFVNELEKYTEEDIVGLLSYGLYSENVFYYFSWDLYDLGLEPSATTNSGYKDLLLGEDGAGFFYNKTGNGELKDFMDMKSLFTYVIPYLKQCNDLVREWDSVYGIFIYDGVPTEDGHWEDEAILNSQEMKQKYWHNLNVNRLYSMYTPWVDVMYDCSYADGEYIHSMGNKYFVENPIDPASYPEERPMVFSESEMQDYGLGRGDLTKVERLILDCNRGMEERMYELLNYFNFSDVTLNTAAAMNCAFEFNSTFSENGFFGNNKNIYPQAFELSDFSYDAFLRFILSNTTGEAMNTKDDFYANIVNNSSMTTALVMICLDVISMYVLPAFKIFFLIATFLSAILIIVCKAFNVDPEQKFIKKILRGVVLPMIKFMITTVGFSYAISLFMGVGNNAVTQTKDISISMGSPVTVMICMIAINILVMYLYFKIIKTVLDSIKHNAKMSVNFMGGVAGAAAGMIGASAISKAVRKSSSSESVASSGTGVSSSRAEQRGNRVNSSEFEEPVKSSTEDTRRNDTKRDTIKVNNAENSKMSDKEKTKSLNEKTTNGMRNFSTGDTSSSERESNSRRRDSSKNVKDLGNSNGNK